MPKFLELDRERLLNYERRFFDVLRVDQTKGVIRYAKGNVRAAVGAEWFKEPVDVDSMSVKEWRTLSKEVNSAYNEALSVPPSTKWDGCLTSVNEEMLLDYEHQFFDALRCDQIKGALTYTVGNITAVKEAKWFTEPVDVSALDVADLRAVSAMVDDFYNEAIKIDPN